MKKIICAFMIMCIALLSFGCNFMDKPLKLSYDLKSEPKNLDPQSASDEASLNIINNVFEGLLTIDADGNIKNGMATKYDISSDKLKYTFTLRTDAKWTDNYKETQDVPVTANDFVFAFRRLLDNETNSPYANLYYCIKNAKDVHNGKLNPKELGVVATSTYEFVINLEYESKNLLNLLTMTSTAPCNEKFFYSTKGKYGLEPETIMTNGAFIIGKWKHDEYVKLLKNDEYYQQNKVVPASISLWIKTIDEKQNNKNNSVDRLLDEKTLASVVDGSLMNKLSKKGFNSEPIETSTWGIAFNLNQKMLGNKNIRLAIATAFDRSTYEKILPENLSIATAIIPHGVMMTNKSYRDFAGETLVQTYDEKKAFEYLKVALIELEKKNVDSIKLMIPKNSNVAFSEHFLFPSQVLQRELGIFIGIDEVEPQKYIERLKKGDFDCAMINLETFNNTPRSILNQFKSDNEKNYYGYNNEQVNQSLIKAAIETDIDLANKSYKLAEQQIIDDAAFIPMYYKTDYFVVSQSVRGLIYNKQTGLISFRDAVKS